jgi:hypothetical protein
MPENDVRQAATGPGEEEISEEEVARIEEERRQRLADENRPEGAEIDNSDRDFDSEAGKFTDSPGYDPGDKPFDDEAGETGAARSARSGGEGPASEPPGEDEQPGA